MDRKFTMRDPYREADDPRELDIRKEVAKLEAQGKTCIALPERLRLGYKIQQLADKISETKGNLEPSSVVLYSLEFGVLFLDLDDSKVKFSPPSSWHRTWKTDPRRADKWKGFITLDSDFKVSGFALIDENRNYIRNENSPA